MCAAGGPPNWDGMMNTRAMQVQFDQVDGESGVARLRGEAAERVYVVWDC